jgi:hypothetical protein
MRVPGARLGQGMRKTRRNPGNRPPKHAFFLFFRLVWRYLRVGNNPKRTAIDAVGYRNIEV